MNLTEKTKKLEKDLSVLRIAQERADLEAACTSINQILYSLIAENPAEVNAIEISTRIVADRPDIGMTGILFSNSPRYVLREFLKLTSGSDDVGKTIDSKFIMHLPFAGPPGTKKEGTAVYNNIQAAVQFHPSGTFRYLKLNLGGSLLWDSAAAEIRADEILGMGLINSEQFSPHLALDLMDGNYSLTPSESSVRHYLNYRGFGPGADAEIPDIKLRKQVESILSSMLVPHWSVGLIDYVNKKNPRLEGFAVILIGKMEIPIMYEFIDFKLPQAFCAVQDRSVGIAYAMAQCMYEPKYQREPPTNVKIYGPDKIIPRLHSVRPSK
jgi:hypothetical protein